MGNLDIAKKKIEICVVLHFKFMHASLNLLVIKLTREEQIIRDQHQKVL